VHWENGHFTSKFGTFSFCDFFNPDVPVTDSHNYLDSLTTIIIDF